MWLQGPNQEDEPWWVISLEIVLLGERHSALQPLVLPRSTALVWFLHKTGQKRLKEGKGLIGLYFQAILLGEVRAGTQARALSRDCGGTLLVGLLAAQAWLIFLI